MRRTVSALIAIAVLAAAGAAAAYEFEKTILDNPVTWPGGEIVMTLSTGDFEQGGDFALAVVRASDAWNDVPGTFLDFDVITGECDGVLYKDGVNCVYFGDLDEGILGQTSVSWSSTLPDYENADVGFNENEDWTVGVDGYFQLEPPYVFDMVALHELGHATGLDHEDDILTVMNTFYPAGGPIGPDLDIVPSGDDRAGLRAMYGADPPDVVRDLAASNYERTGPGESAPIEPPVQLEPGESFTFHYTVVNLGTEEETDVNVAFFLSEDERIVPSQDTPLGTTTIEEIWHDEPYEGKQKLSLPEDLPDSNQYFGFYVDPDNEIGENEEANNSLAATAYTMIGEGGPVPGDDDDSGGEDDDDDDTGWDRSGDDDGNGGLCG